ncbi:hypothetical protein PENTCL1PPCAC_9590, partial [Pristionchus entomophagus]
MVTRQCSPHSFVPPATSRPPATARPVWAPSSGSSRRDGDADRVRRPGRRRRAHARQSGEEKRHDGLDDERAAREHTRDRTVRLAAARPRHQGSGRQVLGGRRSGLRAQDGQLRRRLRDQSLHGGHALGDGQSAHAGDRGPRAKLSGRSGGAGDRGRYPRRAQQREDVVRALAHGHHARLRQRPIPERRGGTQHRDRAAVELMDANRLKELRLVNTVYDTEDELAAYMQKFARTSARVVRASKTVVRDAVDRKMRLGWEDRRKGEQQMFLQLWGSKEHRDVGGTQEIKHLRRVGRSIIYRTP